MKFRYLMLLVSLSAINIFSQPVFKNPGLPSSFTFELSEYFDPVVKYDTTKISVSQKEKNGTKYFHIFVNEGNKFTTEMEINYTDLTTISEKRVDLSNNTVVESFSHNKNQILFYNKAKNVNLNVKTDEKNIYSPYGFLISFSGFPFEKEKGVTIKSYIYEYGDVLTMKVTNLGKQKVSVKAGSFECYKLELAVGGWQSMFASQKSYLYFTVAVPTILSNTKKKMIMANGMQTNW